MTPGPNYLLLQPTDTGERKTDSGIVYQLQNQKDETPTKKGVVVKLGPRVNVNMKNNAAIRTGYTVNYFPDQATEVEFRGDKLLLVHIQTVLSID